MSDHIQPTSSQNPQNTAVESQSVGQFGDWEVIDKEHACCKDLPEKVSGGFSLGRSLGRVVRAVEEGVSAFFQKLFGTKSKALTNLSEVKENTVSAKNGLSSVGLQRGTSSVVPRSNEIHAQPQTDAGKQTSMIPRRASSATSSTQSTASVKQNVSSSSPKYKLVDVPGNGNCGIYAVLVGTGVLRASEFLPPLHGDYGPHPLPNKEQEFFVQQLRSGAAKIAKEQLREKDGSYSEKSLETIRRLEAQHESLADDDFKYVAQVIGRPIEVYSQQPGGFARTLFQPNGETTFLFPGDLDPSDKNIIRLHLDGGHYQLMVPD